MKKTTMLSETDISRITKKIIQESKNSIKPNQKENTLKLRQGLNEGSTWEGIKGYFRGKGYYYTKYLTQVQDVIEKLQKKIINDKKIQSNLDEISQDVNESSMEDFKKTIILDLMNRISDTIQATNHELEDQIKEIKNLKY